MATRFPGLTNGTAFTVPQGHSAHFATRLETRVAGGGGGGTGRWSSGRASR